MPRSVSTLQRVPSEPAEAGTPNCEPRSV